LIATSLSSRPSIQPSSASTGETHSAAALRIVLGALEALGCDLARETGALGLTVDQVHDIEGRIPRWAYCALWQRLADVSGDPDCGLRLAQRLPTGALGVLEYVASNAPTIGEGFASIARYGRLLDDAGVHELITGDGVARFVYRSPTSSTSPRAVLDWAFAHMIVAGRRGAKIDFCPRRVLMHYPRPADTSALEALYRCPIEFSRPATELWFEPSVLDLPVRHADTELGRLMAAFAARQIAKLAAPAAADPFAGRLRAEITARLSSPTGPVLADVARSLGVSARTLQRRLSERGVTFPAAVAEVRLALARSYLAEGDLSLSEIAFLLGFSESSAFHRAFKRAFGSTPAEYRAHHRRELTGP
jgi:AraC-like DNA-binding protein